MKNIKIDQIALAVRRIQRIPFLLFTLKKVGTDWRASAILLLSIAGILFTLASYIAGPKNSTNTIANIHISHLLAIAAILPILISAWGICCLNKLARTNAVGTYNNWVTNLTSKKKRIPITFPKGFWNRCIALTALLAAIIIATMFVFIIPATFISLTTALLGLIDIFNNADDPELIGKALGRVMGSFFPIIIFAIILNASWRIFRRLTSTPSIEILKIDQRSPILLLRSFEDDQIKFKAGSLGTKAYFEEAIAASFWGYGPVIAIGKPGERLPRVGACREYCEPQNWQVRILELFDAVSTVVFIIGLTEGLDWEFSQLRDRGKIKNCIFLLPPLPAKKTLFRLQKIKEQLPELVDLGEFKKNSIHHIRAIFFDKTGVPICFTSKRAMPPDYDIIIHAAFLI